MGIQIKRNSFGDDDKIWAFSLSRRRELWMPVTAIEAMGKVVNKIGWILSEPYYDYAVVALEKEGYPPYHILIETKNIVGEREPKEFPWAGPTLANLGDD